LAHVSSELGKSLMTKKEGEFVIGMKALVRRSS